MISLPKVIPIVEIRPPRDIAGVTLFGGDRMAVCDEALVIEADADQIGIVTLAPRGEDGKDPAIVGLWVDRRYRRRGLGLQLLEAALFRCQTRGWKKVRLDTVTPAGLAVAKRVWKDLASIMEIRMEIRNFSSPLASMIE